MIRNFEPVAAAVAAASTESPANQLQQQFRRQPRRDQRYAEPKEAAPLYNEIFWGAAHKRRKNRDGRILPRYDVHECYPSLHRCSANLTRDRHPAALGLHHEVVLIGAGKHLELWDAERWQAYLNANAPRFDAMAEGAFRR